MDGDRKTLGIMEKLEEVLIRCSVVMRFSYGDESTKLPSNRLTKKTRTQDETTGREFS